MAVAFKARQGGKLELPTCSHNSRSQVASGGALCFVDFPAAIHPCSSPGDSSKGCVTLGSCYHSSCGCAAAQAYRCNQA